jgi:hypothetical protein
MKAQINFDRIDTAAVPAPTKAFGNRKDSPFDPLIKAAVSNYDQSLCIPVTSTKEYMRYRGGLQRAAKRAKVQIAFSKDQTHMYLTALPPAKPQPVKVQPAVQPAKKTIAA